MVPLVPYETYLLYSVAAEPGVAIEGAHIRVDSSCILVVDDSGCEIEVVAGNSQELVDGS